MFRNSQAGKAQRRLGRRGAFLLSWGLLFVVYGIGFYASPLADAPRRAIIVHEMIPHQIRAAIWIVTGLVAIGAAFHKSPGGDTRGFMALLIMPSIRTVSYGFSWAISLFTTYGEARGFVSAAFYLVFVVSVIIVAGFHEDRGFAPNRGGARGSIR